MDIKYTLPNITSTLQIIGCHIDKYSPPWSYPSHHHYLFELLYCKTGQINQYIGDKVIKLNQGDCLVIKSGILHSSELCGEQDYSFFNLHFDIDDPLIRQQLCLQDFIVMDDRHAEQLKVKESVLMLEQIIHKNSEFATLESEKARFRLIIQAHTLHIISQFIAYLQQRVAIEELNIKKEPISSITEAEIAHKIEAKLRQAKQVRINEIAAALGLTRGRATAIFTKVYGQSPRQYLSKIVMNNAKHLLVHSTHTIEEISELLGFQSASHFSRQFRRWTGSSPSAFRPKYIRTSNLFDKINSQH